MNKFNIPLNVLDPLKAAPKKPLVKVLISKYFVGENLFEKVHQETFDSSLKKDVFNSSEALL